MMKGILLGLGALVVGAAIWQAKKEQEFNDNIDNITRQTVDGVIREMDRMTQETINNINNQQFMNQQMHNMNMM